MASICEGYLYKKGDGWSGIGLTTGFRERRRWFVLDIDRKELSYYKESPLASRSSISGPRMSTSSRMSTASFDSLGAPGLELPVGTIELSKARMIDTAHIAAAVFAIVLQHRVFELRAASEEEARLWVASLQPLVHSPSRRNTPRTSTVASMHVQANQIRNAAPWCIEAIWLDGCEDVPLDITAHLGKLPDDRSFTARVRLSDGTTYMVDSRNFDLADGHSHEIAAAGVSKLFAKLVPSSACGPASPDPPDVLPVIDEGSGRLSAVEVSLALRTLCLFVGAAFCAGGTLAIALVDLFGRAFLSSLLMAAACVALASCWKDVAAALRPRQAQQLQERSEIVAPMPGVAPCNYDLVLHAVKEVSTKPADIEPAGSDKVPSRSSGPARTMSVVEFLDLDQLQPNAVTNAVNFTGRWKLNVARSSDPTEMLTALGVPWIARKALAGASRTVEVEHEGLAWTETTITAVITKTTSFSLGGSPYQEISPVDKSVIRMSTQYEEDGQCVTTQAIYPGGSKTQEIRRYLIEDGATYYIMNKLKVGSGKVIESASYFEKVKSNLSLDDKSTVPSSKAELDSGLAKNSSLPENGTNLPESTSAQTTQSDSATITDVDDFLNLEDTFEVAAPSASRSQRDSCSAEPALSETNKALLANLTDREIDILLPLKAQIEQQEGWELVSNSNGLECCRRRVDCTNPGRERPILMWRLRQTMSGATPKEVFDLVMDGPCTPTWHRHVSSWREINREHGAALIATCFRGVFPVSAREALEFRAVSEGAVAATGEYWIAFSSQGTRELDVPVTSKHERTYTCMAGYRIRPGAEPGTAEFTFLAHTDPGGTLPDRVVEMAGAKGGSDYVIDLQKGLDARRKKVRANRASV